MTAPSSPAAAAPLAPCVIEAGEGTLLHAFGDTILMKLGRVHRDSTASFSCVDVPW